MPSINCSFCDHANPSDAKFCNECGADLGLRPCAQCEAINDVKATSCHHCGALLAGTATAVTSAANVDGVHATASPPLMRSQPSGSSATDAGASLPEVGAGKTAFASPRELATAAERLDAFWRDSMQAVEVARAMKGDVTTPAAPPPGVEMLPLRVMDDTPVIDAEPDSGAVLRKGSRVAIAAALLIVAAGIVYYGYERTSDRSAAPTATPAVVAAPRAEPTGIASPPAAPVIAPEPAATAAQTTLQPPAASVSATSPTASDTAAPIPGTVNEATAGAAQPAIPRDAVAAEPGNPARDESSATAPGKVTTTAVPTLDTATTPDGSATAALPTTSEAQKQVRRPNDAAAIASSSGSARHAPARSRSIASGAATPPRYTVPRQRQPASVVIAAPPPVARTPVAPVPAASCTDSTAALGLCSR